MSQSNDGAAADAVHLSSQRTMPAVKRLAFVRALDLREGFFHCPSERLVHNVDLVDDPACVPSVVGAPFKPTMFNAEAVVANPVAPVP